MIPDADTLILARDWGPGTMTASGYPFVVKTLKRGQSLDQASEVFRGQPSDVEVDASALHDGDGNEVTLISRGTDFFHSETYQFTHGSVQRLYLPEKIDIDGLLNGRLIVTLKEDWSYRGDKVRAGSIMATNLLELRGKRGVIFPHPAPTIFTPTGRQSVDQVAVAAHGVSVAVYDNVRGRIIHFEGHGAEDWSAVGLPLADNQSVSIDTASLSDETAYVRVESFLDPTQLFQTDGGAAANLVKSLPARFDASRDTVELFEATSTDGTQIP